MPVAYRDRNGNLLKDGDKVLSYNIMAPGEEWPSKTGKPKIGVPAIFRIGPFPSRINVSASAQFSEFAWLEDEEGGSTGCPDPHDPTYGVDLLIKE